MVSQKGMATGLKVAVVAIVILSVAVVVLGIFTGGIQGIASVINSWVGGGDPCDIQCNTWKLTCKPGSYPKTYSEFFGCGEETDFCDCKPAN